MDNDNDGPFIDGRLDNPIVLRSIKTEGEPQSWHPVFLLVFPAIVSIGAAHFTMENQSYTLRSSESNLILQWLNYKCVEHRVCFEEENDRVNNSLSTRIVWVLWVSHLCGCEHGAGQHIHSFSTQFPDLQENLPRFLRLLRGFSAEWDKQHPKALWMDNQKGDEPLDSDSSTHACMSMTSTVTHFSIQVHSMPLLTCKLNHSKINHWYNQDTWHSPSLPCTKLPVFQLQHTFTGSQRYALMTCL